MSLGFDRAPTRQHMTQEQAYQKALALVKSGKYIDLSRTPEAIERFAESQRQPKKRIDAQMQLAKAPVGWVRAATPPYGFTREPQSEQSKGC